MRRGLRVQILSPRPVDVFLTGRNRPRHVIGVSLFISMLHFAGLLDPHVPERTRRALCRRNAPRSPRVASLDVSAEATVVLNRTYSEKARLIERLLGGNRRAALDVLSEIRPKNASIINRVRAWKQLVIDLVRRLSTQLKSTADRLDANCVPQKRSEPEHIGKTSPRFGTFGPLVPNVFDKD
jgi:hypothetical protein